MQKKPRSKYITILFVPDDEGRTHSLRVHHGIVRTLIVFVAFFIIGIAALIYVSGDIALKLQLVYSLQNENEYLHKENGKLLAITSAVDRIQQMGDYLKRIALTTNEDRPAPAGTVAATAHAQQNGAVFEKDDLDKFLDTIRLFKSRQNDSVAQMSQKSVESIPYMRPVDGWITRSFGADSQNMAGDHSGIDFAAPPGALIRAPAPGTVKTVAVDPELGKVITLSHGTGLLTRYGHCSQILVSEGDRVHRGQTIALIGNTGRSSAPHLHYEVIKDGKSVDPLRYILDIGD